MKIEPLQSYLLLSVKDFYHADSSVVIPLHLQKKIPVGTVISYGNYCEEEYKEGQEIIFTKQGTKVLPGDLCLVPEFRISLKEE